MLNSWPTVVIMTVLLIDIIFTFIEREIYYICQNNSRKIFLLFWCVKIKIMGQDALAAEVLKEKTARRSALRAEYWKQVTNPHRHGTGEGGHIVSRLLDVTSPLLS